MAFICHIYTIPSYFDVYLLDYTLLCLIGIIPISHIHTIHLYKYMYIFQYIIFFHFCMDFYAYPYIYMDMLGGLNSIDKLIRIT